MTAEPYRVVMPSHRQNLSYRSFIISEHNATRASKGVGRNAAITSPIIREHNATRASKGVVMPPSHRQNLSYRSLIALSLFAAMGDREWPVPIRWIVLTCGENGLRIPGYLAARSFDLSTVCCRSVVCRSGHLPKTFFRESGSSTT